MLIRYNSKSIRIRILSQLDIIQSQLELEF